MQLDARALGMSQSSTSFFCMRSVQHVSPSDALVLDPRALEHDESPCAVQADGFDHCELHLLHVGGVCWGKSTDPLDVTSNQLKRHAGRSHLDFSLVVLLLTKACW